MFSPLVLIPVTLILILLISKTWERWTRKDKSKLLKAPGVGYGYIPLIGKWLGAYTFMKDPRGTLMNGATLYRGQYFRISSHHIEFHLFTTKERLAEYLKAPNDVLSFTDNINEGFQTEWTFGYEVAHQPYHIPLLRTKFTKSIPRKIPVMANKIADSILSLLGNPPGI
jgi:hypothetical protein